MVSMQRPRYAPMGSGVCRLLIFPQSPSFFHVFGGPSNTDRKERVALGRIRLTIRASDQKFRLWRLCLYSRVGRCRRLCI